MSHARRASSAALLSALGVVLVAQEPPPCPELPAPGIARGPYLQSLLSTSVEVVWNVDPAAGGSVRFREVGAAEWRTVASAPGAAHRVRLDGLAHGAVHEYEVLDAEGRPLASGPALRFRTSPPRAEAGPIRAVALGDSGTGGPEQLAVARLICALEPGPDIFLHTGDLLYTLDEDAGLFLPYRAIMVGAAFFPARGNPDLALDGTGQPRWEDLFFPPAESTGETPMDYSFDWGSAHFATIDTGDFHIDGPTDDLERSLEWLRQDLERAREDGARWLVLFTHEPVYTLGGYGREAAALRPHVLPVIDDLQVDLVLSGHDHNYQRSHPVRGGARVDLWQDPRALISPRGTVFVVTGGGGGVTYGRGPPAQTDQGFVWIFEAAHHFVQLEVTPEEIEVSALGLDIDGRDGPREIDTFTIRKGPPRPFAFLRGDADASGHVNLGDAVAILNHLFQGMPIACPVVGDSDGSGLPLDLADPVYLLNHLFRGEAPLAAPYPECDFVPDADDEECVKAGCA